MSFSYAPSELSYYTTWWLTSTTQTASLQTKKSIPKITKAYNDQVRLDTIVLINDEKVFFLEDELRRGSIQLLYPDEEASFQTAEILTEKRIV